MARKKRGRGGQTDSVAYRKSEQFISVHKSLWECTAFRTLKPPAQILLFHFIFLAYPNRNGRIGMSHSKAAQIAQVNKATAGKYLDELMVRGFLEMRNHEMWKERKAREYRITLCYCEGRAPTEEFRNWKLGLNFFGRDKKFAGTNEVPALVALDTQ